MRRQTYHATLKAGAHTVSRYQDIKVSPKGTKKARPDMERARNHYAALLPPIHLKSNSDEEAAAVTSCCVCMAAKPLPLSLDSLLGCIVSCYFLGESLIVKPPPLAIRTLRLLELSVVPFAMRKSRAILSAL